MKRILRRKATSLLADPVGAVLRSAVIAVAVFEDRRKQQIPFPSSRCRRMEDRFNDVYDDRPWYLKVNYVTHHASAGKTPRDA